VKGTALRRSLARRDGTATALFRSGRLLAVLMNEHRLAQFRRLAGSPCCEIGARRACATSRKIPAAV
jgi:hypothetical protein